MAAIGSLSLVLSLVVSLYGAMAAFLGARQKSRRFAESAVKAVWVVAILGTLATAILFYALITHDFQVKYVHQYTSTHLPLIYRISAFWAGQEGSLLLWHWLLTILTLIVVQRRHPSEKNRRYLLGILALAEAFFAFLLVATGNPFDVYAAIPVEGVGMLPLLENPGMVVHPPVLFLGYAGYTLPFAFALAALMAGKPDSDWLKAMRRWNLFAWVSLTAGIIIGAWWSYVELGWGGYWAWDPVENASLIPWLIGTAFLHSAMAEERRGVHRVWNIVLATLAFVSCIFATLVTRGGIILSDLHGFSRTIRPIAYYLIAFMAVALLGTFALTYHQRGRLKSKRELGSLLSRDGSFLLVNLLFCAAALVVFVGTAYPTLAQALRGVMVSLNASFYNRAVTPFMMIIICLMGVCPVIGWQRVTAKSLRNLRVPSLAALLVTVGAFIFGVLEPFPLLSTTICSFVVSSLLGTLVRDVLARRRSTGENYHKALLTLLAKAHRRYGAYLVHLGIILMVIGITGSTAYKREKLISLSPGQSVMLGSYLIQYEGFAVETLDAEPATYQSRVQYSTTLSIFRNGSKVATLRPEKNYHWVLDTPWVTNVAIRSTLKEDLYTILASLEQDGLASFQLVISPLVIWIWI
ncbi:MAG: cytochrome c biogenesis protein CcsA, partial [Anaerolineae bacterium]|nr:cytochrome c biogenesis protein CcsA [Anaerolineae bacterium]